ncbi:methyltransferase [Fusarium napiforme]|uniref:Methyltransferase n=1 Tax=Fusarium napiforme TaxID=42672 RepID=A0A8H5MXY8_9HYPO|nr:methyltransferase [Fusarium napiforme]
MIEFDKLALQIRHLTQFYMTTTTPSLTSLADAASQTATALAAKLEKGGFPAPSFEQDGLADYPKDPGIIGVRMQLLDATTDLYRLALGPTDSSFMGPLLTFWDYVNREVEGKPKGWRRARFAECMQVAASASVIKTDDLLKSAYDWNELGEATVVDIGGSGGHDSTTISQAFLNLKFIVQDLPQLRASFDEQVPVQIKSRVKFEPHDFLQAQNTQGDVYMLKMVLHDWPDEYAANILRLLVPHLERGSRVLLVEAVAPPDTAALPFATLSHMLNAADMHMLQFFNSQERSLQDWTNLLVKTEQRLTFTYVSEVPGSVHQFLEVGLRT